MQNKAIDNIDRARETMQGVSELLACVMESPTQVSKGALLALQRCCDNAAQDLAQAKHYAE